MRSITAMALRKRAEEMLESARYIPDPSQWRIADIRMRCVESHARDLVSFAAIIDNLESEIETLTSEVSGLLASKLEKSA